MSNLTNGDSRFKVVLLASVAKDLKIYHQHWLSFGRGAEFLDVLRRIDARLRKDPREFGDPLYRLPAMKLLVFHAAIRPLAVTYGVHDELPLVFVRVAKLLS